jgi:hypothetical protein
MSNDLKRLAARRAQLVAQCEQQRVEMAQEVASLTTPFSTAGVGGYLGSHKKLMLALAGAVLGLVATRPKRLVALAAGGLSMWKMARNVLPLLRSDVR